MEEMIQRINALYHKSQKEGLTEAEKEEQARLRKAYVENIRAGLRGQLDQISIVEKDGSITNLKEKVVEKNKKSIREKSLKLRNDLSVSERKEKSKNIRNILFALDLYKEAEIILSYVAYQSEVYTLSVIEHSLADGKKVFCPKVQGENIEFYQIENTEMLETGYKGILEPSDISAKKSLQEILKQENDSHILMLMPGCAFDRNCGRLGYGKGFYDRYLKRNNDIAMRKIALSYECQMWPEIPQDERDVRPDMLITEEAVYQPAK